VGLDDVLDDREAEAGSPEGTTARLVDAVESLEQPREMLRLDAASPIDDADGRRLVL